MNSPDGRINANAAIVPAGNNAVSFSRSGMITIPEAITSSTSFLELPQSGRLA
jgi:hypothetical protein